MNKRGTGSILWDLVTGNDDEPTLTPGKPTSFFCNTIPDRCPTGPLAYYLPVFLLTIFGSLVQPASGGSPIPWDRMPQALISSIQLLNAWHGTPISNNYVTGDMFNVVEYHQNGFVRPVRERPPMPSTGTTAFAATFALRPSTCAVGNLETETSQLALLYQTAQLKINTAPESVLTGLSSGATFTGLEARISAVLVPRNELVLGTPVEAVLHEMPASSSGNQVQLKGFGTDTALTGIENKGGVLSLLAMSNANNQGGAFGVEKVTNYNFQWAGQDLMQNPVGFFSMNAIAQLPRERSAAFPTAVAGGDANMNQYPYTMVKDDINFANDMDLSSALFWPMRHAGADITLSDVQTADADKSFYLTVDGGFTGDTHLILGFYARRFTDSMRANWVKKLTGGNDPLAAYVLGADNVAKAQLGQRIPSGKHLLTNDNFTYLPWQLSVPTS